MPEIIEPHPKLMQYLADASALFTDFDGGLKVFVDNDEWHYIPSELDQNIYLMRRLEEKGLLKSHNSVFDCGIGLATAMFDLHLQSGEIEGKTFEFGGVEKHRKYLDYLNEKLMHYWDGKLFVVEGDIMDQDYSGHDIVYTYSPFKSVEKLTAFYTKLVSEISTGSLIIEARNYGKGHLETLAGVEGLEEIPIDEIFVYRKK